MYGRKAEREPGRDPLQSRLRTRCAVFATWHSRTPGADVACAGARVRSGYAILLVRRRDHF